MYQIIFDKIVLNSIYSNICLFSGIIVQLTVKFLIFFNFFNKFVILLSKNFEILSFNFHDKKKIREMKGDKLINIT